MRQVITIEKDGAVSGLEHKTGFNLRVLGKAAVKRASEIVFDEPEQAWEVVFLNNNEKTLGSKKLGLWLYHECGVHSMGLNAYVSGSRVFFREYHEAARAEVAVLDYYRLRGVFN